MSSPDIPEPHRRSIRSFVLRAGRITAAQERALVDLWPVFGIDYAASPLDLDATFGRHAPRLLEIGFGTGDALAAFAATHPGIDCLGVEVHRAGVGHLLMTAEAQRLANLKIIAHDAVEVLANQIAPGSLAGIHIFFPDPWPKKRHHKRRLIQPPFAELLVRALRPDGDLRLATDWQPYAEHMLEVLSDKHDLVNVAGNGVFAARLAERPVTRFERRGERLGHMAWDLHFRKRLPKR